MRKEVEEAVKSTFGTVFADKISVARFQNNEWSPFKIQPMAPFEMHPATHCLHYGSTCFEGLKIHRWSDGTDHTFRLDRHIRRMQSSAQLLYLPVPEADLLENMIVELVKECRDWIPDHPGALYVRPTLLGSLKSIGAAAAPSSEALLYILLSPVGDYFSAGLKPLKLLLDDIHMRTSPDFGQAKTGGNYASALHHIQEAKAQFGTDQVLFAPGGDVQETGAANFLLINDKQIRTKKLDASFLHGVTRDSILKLGAQMGYEIIEDDITVGEVLEWTKTGEAALSGTAAVLAGVGSLVYRGEVITFGSGEVGPNTMKLRNALTSIQDGGSPDTFGWSRAI